MNRIRYLLLLLTLSLVLPIHANEVEEQFRKVKTSFEERQKDAQNDLKQYLADYPYTTYRSETNLMIAVLQTEKERYKQALRTFGKIEVKELERNQQPMYWFYKGYVLLQKGEEGQAAACFKLLKDTGNPYTLQAQYYYAYCSYKVGNYNRALPDFLAIEHTAQYKHIVPYYIVQIYYAQHQYDEVYERAAMLLRENPESEYTGELHRIMGEIYYTQGQYLGAADHLRAYEEDYTKLQKELLREDIYLLGITEYQLENWQAAIKYLKKVKQIRDTISENTCLHMGNAYVKIGDIEHAKLSYQAAIRFNLNRRVREEAMYNYALATYQCGTALGESINAFNDFLDEYPNTAHAEDVYALLADMYRSSKNYKAALESIERIQNPTSKLRETKQYLRYQLGADAFLQGKLPMAMKWMQEVVDNEKASSQYKTEAYYYLAECNYRLHHYDKCYQLINTYLAQPDVEHSKNYNAAFYLKGYALFSLKQYGEAEMVFRRYIAGNADPTFADALNRIGDCCFNNRSFEEAANTYQRVIEMGQTGADYATFQRGYALGLMHRYSEKAQVMEHLVKAFPKSDYADDALYEIARAQLQADQNDAAIDAYTRLITRYPNSNYARKASLELAMIYRNQRRYTEALDAYRTTIERYPGSEEAYSALSGMEQVYVETNNITDYLAFTRQLGTMNMNVVTAEDSLTYVTAELQYMQGNYREAALGLSNYISSYCAGGRYCTMASYYRADAYYRLNDTLNALNAYLELVEITGNPYMLEAYTRIAELSYDRQDYQTARTYFTKMQPLCTTEKQSTAAMIGILRTSYFLGDQATTVDIATQILADDNRPADVLNEAHYNRGKAYYRAGSYGLAVVDMNPLSKDVRIETGAEAKYILADCYFHLGALDDAEQEIMSFAQTNTQHQYWLAKSLILLSDINVQRGDLFQARQYLLTLQNNYKGEDDIQAIVNEHLQTITDMETAAQTEQEEEDE